MPGISPKDPPRVAIATATASSNTWSETFIAGHVEHLREVVLVLSDGMLPRNDGYGKPILAASLADRLARSVELRLMGRPLPDVLRRRIAARLRRERVQVVLAEYGPVGEELLWSCQRAGVPLVVHFHGIDASSRNHLARYANYQRIFHGAATLVVVSRAMERRLLELGAPRGKVVYNCYGVDSARFTMGTPETSPPHFAAVGRFVDKKAPHLLIEAFRLTLAERPNARLTMAGHGPLHESCDRLVRAAGLADRITLCGVITPGEVASLMRGCRAFVQHSVVAANGDSEGTPVAVLEAMASGLPVIATTHAGIVDVVVHEERGLLCAEGDVRTMARHIVRLVDDPAAAGRMGAAGRAHVERHHRMENSIATLQGILDRAASDSS